jgi:hypothetical protein
VRLGGKNWDPLLVFLVSVGGSLLLFSIALGRRSLPAVYLRGGVGFLCSR